MSKKLSVAILFGGRSVEHDISVISAQNVAKYIDKNLYDPIFIGITTEGGWYKCESVDKDIEKGQPLRMKLDARACAFTTTSGSFSVDVAFPVLHGTDGEDGSIQGLLKAMDLPFVGSGVLGSSVAMDKLISKKLLEADGIPVCPYVAFQKSEKGQYDFEKVVAIVGLPMIVKPAGLGSSVGVTKIKSESDFDDAINETFKYDDSLLIEQFVEGRELECAILGNENPIASEPGEIIVNDDYEFYTFDAKYVDKEAAKLVMPAVVQAETVEKIKTLSLRAYDILKCEDLSRVDLFLTEDGQVFVNEINTIPGFTNSSMYPKLFELAGISYTELITKLIQFGIAKFKKLQDLETSYDSGL